MHASRWTQWTRVVFLAATLLPASVDSSEPANPTVAFPPVRIDDRVEHYTITGSSISRIDAQLRKHAESTENADNGYTRSAFEVTSRLEPKQGLCRIAALEVKLNVTTLLPEWQPGHTAWREVRERWAKSLAILERHESGHRANALEAAQALRRTLLALVPKKNCQRVDAAIAIELQTAMRKLEVRDRRYDARTQGGLRDDPLAKELQDGPVSADARPGR